MMLSSMMFEPHTFSEIHRAVKNAEQEYKKLVRELEEKVDIIQSLENQRGEDSREINYYKRIRDKENRELRSANQLLKEKLSSEQTENERLKNELTIRQAENDRLKDDLENSLCVQNEQEEMITHWRDEKEKADHIIRTLMKKIQNGLSPTSAGRQFSQNVER